MIDQEIRNLINRSNAIGIVSHVRPDGDAIGSLLGLGLALIDRGKHVEMVLEDGISNTFRHLEGADQVTRSFKQDCDLYIAVDCSEYDRAGQVLQGHPVDINIDHHITNNGFGTVNLIDPDAVATAEILADHLTEWGLTISLPVASALLTGIVSDSIGFRTSNTSAKSLRIAASLMEKGANITTLYNKALISRSFQATNYWGFALSRLERENGLVWTALTLEDRKNSSYLGNDDADLTNILSSIEDIDIAVLFVEQNANKVKISWRARPDLNVSGLAEAFGGGGHPAAAGAEVEDNMTNVKEQVLEKTRKYLKQVNKGNSAN